MRQLTRDQIIEACGKDSGITKILIGYSNSINIYPEMEKNILIENFLKREAKHLPEEALRRVNYLTCHPTVVCEICFPYIQTELDHAPIK